MTDPTSQVVEVEGQGVSTETTPAAGVAEQAKPGQAPNDAERIRAEYEQKLAASQRDISNLKSTLQKQISQKEKDYADLQRQFREVRLSTMDEGQRKQYETQMRDEELNNLRQQLAEAQAKQQEIAAIADAQTFFLQKGVPQYKLIIGQGYEALVQSGWDAVSEELEGYRKGVQQKQQPAPLQTAPSVVTDKAAPTSKTSWAELVKKYGGSEERVFQLAEQGYISLENVEIPPVV